LIRVNLLPQAGERRSSPESSQTWLLVVMLMVVVEIVGLFFFHQTKEDELEEITGDVTKIQSQITDITARVKDHDKIKAELDVLRQREDAISKLQSGRKGPTAVLLELGRVLTKGKGPTVDAAKLEELKQINPNMIYNPAWDPKRLWLTEYAETERSVRLEGVARDGGDVYELSQRLKLSTYFDDVTLLKGQQTPSTDNSLELVKFALQVKVNY
jgi:type IV pilus assembly protein PilN